MEYLLHTTFIKCQQKMMVPDSMLSQGFLWFQNIDFYNSRSKIKKKLIFHWSSDFFRKKSHIPLLLGKQWNIGLENTVFQYFVKKQCFLSDQSQWKKSIFSGNNLFSVEITHIQWKRTPFSVEINPFSVVNTIFNGKNPFFSQKIHFQQIK